MAFTTHGHHIDGTDTINKPSNVVRCGGPGVCNPCSTEAILHIKVENKDKNDVIKVYDALLETGLTYTQAKLAIEKMQNIGILVKDEFYDDGTMFKVYEALLKTGLTNKQSKMAINEMQNSGILFRERN